MSAQDVASITGVPLEYIQRFEGPVLAEREYVVETALGVPVHTAADTNPFGTGMTFGTAIREPAARPRGHQRAMGELEGDGQRLGREALVHGQPDRP